MYTQMLIVFNAQFADIRRRSLSLSHTHVLNLSSQASPCPHQVMTMAPAEFAT